MCNLYGSKVMRITDKQYWKGITLFTLFTEVFMWIQQKKHFPENCNLMCYLSNVMKQIDKPYAKTKKELHRLSVHIFVLCNAHLQLMQLVFKQQLTKTTQIPGQSIFYYLLQV